LPALPDPPELLPGGGTFSMRPVPPFWAFFGDDCAPSCLRPPEAAAAVLPAGAGAEVADGAEELLEPEA